MKIIDLEIKNFKGLTHVEMHDAPNMVILAGPNGAGKSGILQALTVFKEQVGPYGGFSVRHPVNSKAEFAEIRVRFKVYPEEHAFLRKATQGGFPLGGPEDLEGTIRIDKAGNLVQRKIDAGLDLMLRTYSRMQYPDVGIFDYNDPHRWFLEQDLSSLDLANRTDDAEKARRVSPGVQKFQQLKTVLAQLKLRELDAVQRAKAPVESSLDPIRKIFNELLSPKQFVDVEIPSSGPWRFTVSTPGGDIDIDDLSAGEKEVLFFYADMIQLNPRNSIILIDEPDLHLNQELESKIPSALSNIGSNNQFWIATHSLGIMNSVEPHELFMVESYKNRNQVHRIFEENEKYELFRSVAGDVGIVTLGEKIVFCEGAQHTDVEILNTWFREVRNKIVFVPSGGKSETTLLGKHMLDLLKTTTKYNQFFAIRDRDFLEDNEIDHFVAENKNRLFVWDRYAIENYLLDFETIAELYNEMTVNKKTDDKEIEKWLLEEAKQQRLTFENQLTISNIDSRLGSLRNQVKETSTHDIVGIQALQNPIFNEKELKALTEESRRKVNEWLSNDSWVKRLPAKRFLTMFVKARLPGITFERFRNQVVHRISSQGRVPSNVKSIVDQIVATDHEMPSN